MSTHPPEDEWGKEAPNIMTEERLALVRRILEESPVIVEHRFYRGSRAPDRMVFDSFESFKEYLRQHGQPGDSFWVWRFDSLCRDDNPLTHGKCPDEQGLVPKQGPY
jgi:hypothetical protein